MGLWPKWVVSQPSFPNLFLAIKFNITDIYVMYVYLCFIPKKIKYKAGLRMTRKLFNLKVKLKNH